MAENKPVVLTSEGLEKAEKELEYLKTVKRQEVAEKIKTARGFGDLSENSEYDEAKDEQANMELRIVQLEKMLKNVKVIDDDEVSTEVVSLGSKVTVFDYDLDEEDTYFIVGSAEASPMENKLSDESPIGSALLGKAVDDIVDVNVPDGVLKFKIIAINR